MTLVRIATRGSELALWQAREVARRIELALDVRTELVPLTTTGDRLAGSLAKVGGKGLFVKEIEGALLERHADVAVHSAKDLPAMPHPDLFLVAFLERADPRDALCTKSGGGTLTTLRAGARVGTGSVRRAAQLRRARPDLSVVPLRGNVPTRLAKLDGDGFDAVLLACAGLDRLGLGDHIRERIDPQILLPAVAQGAIAVQARRGDLLADALAALDHAETAACVTAERAFLAALGGDCNVPIAALARFEGATLSMRGMVISPDGSKVAEARREVAVDAARAGGAALAADVLAKGADAILAALREEPTP